MSKLLRHILACNNAILPGGRVPVRVGGEAVGWMEPSMARQAGWLGASLGPEGLSIATNALETVVRGLAATGAFLLRGEAFDVRAEPDRPAIGQIDRGALPCFGIQATGVHLNGLVGEQLWVARRARSKALDPGKLDHLVAGGVGAGQGVLETLVKEGREEADLPEALARSARPVGTIAYAMQRAEGLRRDVLHCYDLELPAEFRPVPADGEVEAFMLWPLADVLHAVRQTDQFKFNVNLVLIDLFIRRGLLAADEAAELRAALDRRDWSG